MFLKNLCFQVYYFQISIFIVECLFVSSSSWICSIEKDEGRPHEKVFVSSVQIATSDSKLFMMGNERTRIKDADNSAASLMLCSFHESDFLWINSSIFKIWREKLFQFFVASLVEMHMLETCISIKCVQHLNRTTFNLKNERDNIWQWSTHGKFYMWHAETWRRIPNISNFTFMPLNT